ncbi:uncharacterized protein LOC143956755 [Lithobates pipiens]
MEVTTASASQLICQIGDINPGGAGAHFSHRPAAFACVSCPKKLTGASSMEREERPAGSMAMEETTGGDDATALGVASRPVKSSTRSKRCGNCNARLPPDHPKPFCFKCIQKLTGKETSQIMEKFLTVQTEMLSTLKAFQSSLKSRDSEAHTSKDASSQEGSASSRGSRRRADNPRYLQSQDSEEEDESESHGQGFSDEGVLDSQEEDEGEDSRSSRHIFSADDMEGLLRAVYASEGIQEPTAQVSAQDKMYRGLIKPQTRVLPVHPALKDIILREWKDPEKRLLKYKTWKRRCPFTEEDEEKFFKTPRLDASLAQVSKQSDLSFEDTGNIKDQMDRRAETILRRAWEANASAMSPALASACIARNADMWISKLIDHISQTSKSKEVLDSLEVVGSAVAYLADAAVETVRTTAKSAALLNSARRALWVKTWDGDGSSKTRLCGLPFEGSLLFGAGLDQVLARADYGEYAGCGYVWRTGDTGLAEMLSRGIRDPSRWWQKWDVSCSPEHPNRHWDSRSGHPLRSDTGPASMRVEFGRRLQGMRKKHRGPATENTMLSWEDVIRRQLWQETLSHERHHQGKILPSSTEMYWTQYHMREVFLREQPRDEWKTELRRLVREEMRLDVSYRALRWFTAQLWPGTADGSLTEGVGYGGVGLLHQKMYRDPDFGSVEEWWLEDILDFRDEVLDLPEEACDLEELEFQVEQEWELEIAYKQLFDGDQQPGMAPIAWDCLGEIADSCKDVEQMGPGVPLRFPILTAMEEAAMIQRALAVLEFWNASEVPQAMRQ